MLRFLLLPLLAGSLALTGCSALVDEDADLYTATYEGILPGTECNEAQVQLVLDARDFHYRWREKATAESDCDTELDREGRWIIEQSPADARQVLYQLDPEDASGPRNLLRLESGDLKMVDEHGEEFWRPYNLILERVDGEGIADDPF